MLGRAVLYMLLLLEKRKTRVCTTHPKCYNLKALESIICHHGPPRMPEKGWESGLTIYSSAILLAQFKFMVSHLHEQKTKTVRYNYYIFVKLT